MKKLRLSLLPVLLLAVASLFAFTNKKSATHKSSQAYFYYTLANGGDPYAEEDYTVKEEEQPSDCGGDDDVCWIRAADNGSGGPDIDGPLTTEIATALSGHDDTDNVRLKN